MTPAAPLEEQHSRGGFDLALWRKLFSYARTYRREVFFIAVFAVGTASVEVLYPLVTRSVIDSVTEGTAEDSLVFHALAYLVLTTVLCGCIFGFVWMGGVLRASVSHDIRGDGFDNLQRLSFSFYDRHPAGRLMARMTSDCERLSNILSWGILDLVWGSTIMTGIAIVMLVLNVKLALTVLAVVPALVAVSVVFQRRILTSARVVRKLNSQMTASYNESLMGNRTSKVFVREAGNLREFSDTSSSMNIASVRNALLSALYLPVVVTLGSLSTGLALVLGGIDLSNSVLSVGTLFAFMAYTGHFFAPVHEMAYWFAEVQMARAAAERVIALVEAEPEIQDSPEVKARIAERSSGQPSPDHADDGYPQTFREIEFRNVSFAYSGGADVLRDFNLVVQGGETIALVGSTGGGKSTIISLLCRFYEPTAGSILFDGVDERSRSLRWLESQFGIVLQTPHLFSGTVAENIRYGNLEAGDDKIVAAAKLVGADDFVRRLENGYETQVGEAGNLLSTGEKQLVSFARAIIAQPPILIMDEATSSIDTETEQQIQRGLDAVLKGRTSFVIAHRLSTILSADRILVVEDGRLVEIGTHADLLERRGRYHALYRLQCAREVFGG